MKSTPVIVFNPTARGDKAAGYRRFLESLGTAAVLRPTQGPGQAGLLAAAAVRDGYTTVVAAGGDGTVNEVANGLCADPLALDSVRLGVLPFGTVNVFAKELGLPENVARAWEAIRGGRERRIDLPEVTFGRGEARARRRLVQLGGAGLDARAIAEVRWEEKKRWGRVAYLLAGLRALRRPAPEIEAVFPDGTSERGELVLLGNGRLYGGWWTFFPEASLEDGKLDVAVVRRATLARLAGMAWAIQRGRFASHPGVVHRQVSRLELRSSAACEFELDGDNVGELPAEITVRARCLRVAVAG